MIVEEKNYPKRQLQRECKEISDLLLFSERLHKEVIYIYPLQFSHWVALLLFRYNREAVETIKTLPVLDRFFYQTKVNRFKQLSIWCIREEHSQSIINQLKTLSNTSLETLDQLEV